MAFGQKVVCDLNVLDLPGLTDQVRQLVSQNKLPVGEVVLVLSEEVYFASEVRGETAAALAERVQEFVDSVPLLHPSSKLVRVGEKYYVVVIDRRLYESIRTAFEAVGWTVTAVVPEMILGPVGVKQPLDAASCRLILRKMDYVRENSFIGPDRGDEESFLERHRSWVVGGLVVVIVASWAVAGGLALQIRRVKQEQFRQAPAAAKFSPATAEPTPPVEEASQSAELRPDQYSILVLNGSGVAGEARRVADLLVSAGLAQAEVRTTSQVTRTVVVYAPEVPQPVRATVAKVLSQQYRQISQIENQEARADIVVTVARTTP